MRHDGDDPYLVVAADKGTATFSDIANGVAEDYGFWLGDAFASGGSVGYDHKAMGITARGGLGLRPAPLPRARRRRPDRGLHRRRHRRHERRRVRQRHAAVRAHPARGRVRPPPHLPRPRPRTRSPRTPSARGCSSCRARPGTDYDTPADQRGRRRLPAHRQVDPAVRAGARGAGRRRRVADADRADVGDPARAGRPAVERRHRHLREGQGRDARRRRRQGQRRAARQRRRAAREGRGRGRQPRLHPARADRVRARRRARSTPTRSTTPAASTAPTTRSTSRSCSTRSWPRATSPSSSATRCWRR